MRLNSLLLASGALVLAGTVLACSRNKADKPAVNVPNGPIQGRILEVLPAAPYAYLSLATPQGQLWSAVPAGNFKAGDAVTIVIQMKMDKFQSSSLKRTFDTLYLGTLPPVGGASAGAPMPSAAPAPAAPQAPDEKVAKATGAGSHAIAELYDQRAGLKDQTVLIKGKVVKANGPILGKNWLHLRDGSGSPKEANNDLAVTTLDRAEVGDIVTVKGVLHLNKDVGSGYVYPLIVEEAKIVH